MNRAYRDDGHRAASNDLCRRGGTDRNWSTALVVAPPSAHGTPGPAGLAQLRQPLPQAGCAFAARAAQGH